MGPLRIDIIHDTPLAVAVHVSGQLDLATTPALRACLWDLLDDMAPRSAIEVDLSAVNFVGICGINLLLDAPGRAADHDVTFFLVGPSVRLLRLLRTVAGSAAPVNVKPHLTTGGIRQIHARRGTPLLSCRSPQPPAKTGDPRRTTSDTAGDAGHSRRPMAVDDGGPGDGA